MSATENDLPPSPPPPSPPEPPRKRLQRSRHDRVIAGVAGGLGEYFDIDPVIFRIGFVVLAFLGGAGILLYPAAWLLLPEEGHRRSIGESWVRSGRHGHWLPITLIVIGGLILAGDLSARHHDGGIGFAVAAIVIGFLLLRRQPRTPRPPEPWSGTPQPPEPGAPPTTTTTESFPTEPFPTDPSSWTPPPPAPPAPLAHGQAEPPPGGGGELGNGGS